MKNNTMNLTLTKSSIDSVERLLSCITEFLDTLKHSQKTLRDNITFCRKLRTNRKKFEKEMLSVIKQFHSLPENKQVEVELIFFKALQKLEVVVPKALLEIEEDRLFFMFSYFLKREVKKTLSFIKKHQGKMATKIYPDHSDKILNDPDQYKKLVEAWGDLAEDEY